MTPNRLESDSSAFTEWLLSADLDQLLLMPSLRESPRAAGEKCMETLVHKHCMTWYVAAYICFKQCKVSDALSTSLMQVVLQKAMHPGKLPSPRLESKARMLKRQRMRPLSMLEAPRHQRALCRSGMLIYPAGLQSAPLTHHRVMPTAQIPCKQTLRNLPSAPLQAAPSSIRAPCCAWPAITAWSAVTTA